MSALFAAFRNVIIDTLFGIRTRPVTLAVLAPPSNETADPERTDTTPASPVTLATRGVAAAVPVPPRSAASMIPPDVVDVAGGTASGKPWNVTTTAPRHTQPGNALGT